MNKKSKKKFSIAGYIVSIVSLILCLYITIEVITANNQNRPPSIFGVSVSYVPTGSMEPKIKKGDYVLFVRASFKDVDEGDIVVYRGDDRFIIHEIIQKNEDTLITKGLANPTEDDPITKDKVCGKYVMTLPFLNALSGGINQNIIFGILISIFFIMLLMQLSAVFLKQKTDEVKQNYDEEKQKLLEEMRKQILQEELDKIKKQKQEQADLEESVPEKNED